MTDIPDRNRPYTVVVGVSDTSKSPVALTWARCQADHCQGRLIAVRAWRTPSTPVPPEGAPAGPVSCEEDVEAEARRALEQDVAAALGDDHTAELRLVRGGKLNVLLEAASEADLLVVDAPRQFVIGPMFAHRLIYAASCPVVAMPPQFSAEQPSTLTRVAETIGRGLAAAGAAAGGTPEHPRYRPPMRS